MWVNACIQQSQVIDKRGITVGSLILRNHFLQIALKLLNTLFCNFAACNTHNFDPMSSGETPVMLWHLVVKIFAKNHSAKFHNDVDITYTQFNMLVVSVILCFIPGNTEEAGVAWRPPLLSESLNPLLHPTCLQLSVQTGHVRLAAMLELLKHVKLVRYFLLSNTWIKIWWSKDMRRALVTTYV